MDFGKTKTEPTEGAKAAAEAPKPALESGSINLGAQADAEEAEKTNHYSSAPIISYCLGSFQFVNGWLSLSDKDAEEFEALVRAQPPAERNRITKYASRPSAPVAIAMTQGIDNSANAPAAPSGEQQA
jgi:hypothetical protein